MGLAINKKIIIALALMVFMIVGLSQPDTLLGATDVKNDASLSTGLVVYWEFEADGTDSHGTENLTENGTPTYATGKQGNALSLDSAGSDYMSRLHASTTDLRLAGDFSISLWINGASDPTAWESLGNKRDGDAAASGRGYVLSLEANGDGVMDTNISDGTTDAWKFVSWAPTRDGTTWYHVVLVYDASAGSADFYVDGSLQGTQQTGLPTSVNNPDSPFLLGAGESSGSPAANTYYDGLIDEYGVWTKTLTTTEITALYNSGSGIPYEAATTPTFPSSVRGGNSVYSGATLIQ